jgi:hypothetical protein
MTDEMITLSRRAVACKGWRSMSGMATDEGHRVVLVDDDVLWMVYSEESKCKPGCVEDFVPDLTDPATLGCLLALVREAWRCPTVYVRQSTTRRVSDGVLAWEVCDLYLDAEACRALGVPREGSVGSWGHGSEAEALVAALESAP